MNFSKLFWIVFSAFMILVTIHFAIACVDNDLPLETGDSNKLCVSFKNNSQPVAGASCKVTVLDDGLVTVQETVLSEETLGIYSFNQNNSWIAGSYVLFYNCSKASISGTQENTITLYDATYIDTIQDIRTDTSNTYATVSDIYGDTQNIERLATTLYNDSRKTLKFTISDFGVITTNKNYTVKITVQNYTGMPANLSNPPKISIYDPNLNTMVYKANTNPEQEGFYTYTYHASTSAVSGVWITYAYINHSGREVVLTDFWRVSGSPADVTINNIPDDTAPGIIAEATITNMGTLDSDFEYVYCIVTSTENNCGSEDGTDTDYASGTRYLTAGESWNANFGLNVPSTGLYYFKIKAKALSETDWAGASRAFTATNIEGSTAAPGGGSATSSAQCLNNNDCPVGTYCLKGSCERLKCANNEMLSNDGHECTLKKAEKNLNSWIIILCLSTITISCLILYKGKKQNFKKP